MIQFIKLENLRFSRIFLNKKILLTSTPNSVDDSKAHIILADAKASMAKASINIGENVCNTPSVINKVAHSTRVEKHIIDTDKMNISYNVLRNSPEFLSNLKTISHLNGEKFAQKAYELMIKKFEIEEIAPKLEIRSIESNSKGSVVGRLDSKNGIMLIDPNSDNANIINSIMHELKHFEQRVLSVNYHFGKNKDGSFERELSMVFGLWNKII